MNSSLYQSFKVENKEEIKVIHSQEVLNKEFKIYGTKEEPLFLAKDVAEWIDYQKISGTEKRNTSKMINLVDEDEKVKLIAGSNNWDTTSTARKTQEMWFLTEDGLYEVLMQSRKPIAKQFKKQVKTILKQIRQTGGYIPVNENMTDEEIMARALLVAQNTIENKNKIIEELKPKAMLVDLMETSKDTFLVRELAIKLKEKGINIGQNRLFKILRDKEYLCSSKARESYNKPTQKAMDLKLFEVKTTTFTGTDGRTIIKHTPKLTAKGFNYFLRKFMEEWTDIR